MGNGMFNTTRWSLVIGTRADSDDGRAALETLCCAYRSPVAAYLRARGHPPSDADDMTQAFFEQLLRRRMHAMADPARGRFRGFLLASLRNFLSSQREHERAGKRGGGQAALALEPGIDLVTAAVSLAERAGRCDLVVTGEASASVDGPHDVLVLSAGRRHGGRGLHTWLAGVFGLLAGRGMRVSAGRVQRCAD